MYKKAVFFLIGISLLAKDVREERLDVFLKDFREMIAAVQRRAAEPNPTPTVRDLPNAALGIVTLGGDAREAEKLVRLAYSNQDMDPASPGYGTVPWQLGHPEIKDANAIEFATQAIGPLFLKFGGKLPPEFKSWMEPHIRAALVAVRRHKVPVTYTNIFLMKTMNLILLNEAIGDMQGASDGYAQLDQWIAHTRENGIREFHSPTYYSVDVNSLLMGRLLAARPEAREKCRRALDYFWADIAANYFAPRGTLSGPHSRDYDFLTGHGGLEFQLFQEGLRRKPATQRPDLEKVFFVLNEKAGGYRPPARILKLAALPERVIQTRWETGVDRDRYNFITRHFAIGSSSANYGPQDKPVAIEVGTDEMWPAISIVPDVTDEPYGKLRRPDRSGHNKPVHLPLYPLCVQEKGALLALLDLNAAKEESVATNVILPAAAALSVDGKTVKSDAAFEREIPLNAVIGVRHGRAAVAIRVFRGEGRLLLKADAPGLKFGAARIALYQKPSDHVRSGFLILAAECAGDADFAKLVKKAREATIADDLSDTEWKASARVDKLFLEAARDAKKRTQIYRRVNGREAPIRVLSVNGEDMTKILQ